MLAENSIRHYIERMLQNEFYIGKLLTKVGYMKASMNPLFQWNYGIRCKLL